MKIATPTARARAGISTRARSIPGLLVSCTVIYSLITGCPPAASATPPPLPSVVVTAPRPPTAAQLTGESVPNFILHHATPPAALGQLTRWREGICPMTQGLSPAFDAFITARIRAVALSVGAPVQSQAKCRVNVEILFTTEPQAAIDDIANASPMLLGNHYKSQLKTLEAVNHPIQGWYVTATRGAYGARLRDDDTRINVMWGNDIGNVVGTVPACLPGSRLETECKSEIINVILIADTRKVAGYTVGSISDYLAVLTLTMVQSPDGCDPLPSILDLMSPSCRHHPDESGNITAGDLAFLKALYRADLKVSPELERGNILAQMMSQFGSRESAK